ncbi:MAG: bifunctional folylpolyglutamate synthase/dihydrofolate synthase, partial [Bacteroidaceae bacterium]|nr:bifunctional folylpolyglutamate synthase/dihydrofolate synthase [Bacteroidaceae bacterium]
ILAREPLTICDTGHNVAGLQYTSRQLENFARPLHIIIGMVSDKDIRTSLRLMPKHATYYFTQASVQRALPAEDFARIAREEGLQGQTYPDVPSAFRAATQQAKKDDIVFVGGSTFIVADLLKNFFA